ncbi:MAG: hypothetical protein AAB150_14035 [Pseudomonadota bacterium]
MSDVKVVPVIPSAVVERLRRKAKKLVKQDGIAHHAALDIVARASGRFTDWHHLIEAAKATEASEQAFKSGLIIGMDPKDVDFDQSRIRRFVRDERVLVFLRLEFEKQHPQPWSEDDRWGWTDIEQLAYFRPKRSLPDSLHAVMQLCREDFFFAPRYVRLKGKVLQDPFSDEAENG